MAKNNKADMSCARVKKYTASDVSKAERHNERKNETYENMNVIVERIPFNVHFKKPTAPTYMEQLKQMETDGQVSLRGLRKDATLFNEIVIDVNTMYFERNGGYEYAKQFYEEAYHFIEEKFGADNVISAVMHADEINVAASEELGKEVYHYHLHAMAKRKRDVQLKFRVTPQEREMIETKMAQFGTTNMAAYLRKMAIDGYVVKLDLPELRELVSLLRYSSNNLNQLTRRAHETGRIYKADLEDIQQNQERIWTAAEKIVSSLAALK